MGGIARRYNESEKMVNVSPVVQQQPLRQHTFPEHLRPVAPSSDALDEQTIVLSGDVREIALPAEEIASLSCCKQAMLLILQSPADFIDTLQEKAAEQINKQIKAGEQNVFLVRADLDKRNERQTVDALCKALTSYQTARTSNTDPALVESLSGEYDAKMADTKMSSDTHIFLQILKAATAIRTPLFMQRVALGADVPELPGVSARAGLQIQTVIPSLTLSRCLAGLEMNMDAHLQILSHFETGWGASVGEDSKASMYAADIEQFGFDYKLGRNEGGDLSSFSLANLSIFFESVQRAEGSLSQNQIHENVLSSEQVTLGGDFVQQRFFACTLDGLVAAGGHVAIQGGAGIAVAGILAGVMSPLSPLSPFVVGSPSIPLILAAAIAGCFVGGKMTTALGILPPTKMVNIFEGLTVGVDCGAGSSDALAGDFRVNVRSMNRLNAAVTSARADPNADIRAITVVANSEFAVPGSDLEQVPEINAGVDIEMSPIVDQPEEAGASAFEQRNSVASTRSSASSSSENTRL